MARSRQDLHGGSNHPARSIAVPCVERLNKHLDQTRHVLRRATMHDVDVLRDDRGALRDRGKPTNDDELNAVTGERRDEVLQNQSSTRERPPAPVRAPRRRGSGRKPSQATRAAAAGMSLRSFQRAQSAAGRAGWDEVVLATDARGSRSVRPPNASALHGRRTWGTVSGTSRHQDPVKAGARERGELVVAQHVGETMHHRSRLLFSALLVGAIIGSIGCAGDPLEVPEMPKDAPALVGSQRFDLNSGSSMATRQRLVIHDSATWVNVWSQLAGNYQPLLAVPVVDFASNVVIVAAMGTQSSSGPSINVDDVRIVAGDVRISVTEKYPNRCGVLPVSTAPVSVVVVPRFAGQATFIEHTFVIDCE